MQWTIETYEAKVGSAPTHYGYVAWHKHGENTAECLPFNSVEQRTAYEQRLAGYAAPLEEGEPPYPLFRDNGECNPSIVRDVAALLALYHAGVLEWADVDDAIDDLGLHRYVDGDVLHEDAFATETLPILIRRLW